MTVASVSILERQARRLVHKREADQARAYRRLVGVYGVDAVGEAIAAAMADGLTFDQALSAAQSSTRSARSKRGNLDKAERREQAKAQQVANDGLIAPRETRDETRARLAGQRFGQDIVGPVLSALSDEHAPRADYRPIGSWQAIMGAAGHRSARVLFERMARRSLPKPRGKHVPRTVALPDEQVTAFIGALLADGPVARADHDPATCDRAECMRCHRAGFRSAHDGREGWRDVDGKRQRVQVAAPTDRHDHGPLVDTAGKVHRDHRAPNEQRRPVGNVAGGGMGAHLLSESSLIRSLDMSNNFLADRLSMFGATSDRPTSLAVWLADGMAVPTTGTRGWSIDTTGWVTRMHPSTLRHLVGLAAGDVAARFTGQSLKSGQTMRLHHAAYWSHRTRGLVDTDLLRAAWREAHPSPMSCHHYSPTSAS